jgi:hypothetical protein
MQFWRTYRAPLLFVVVVLFCAFMTIYQSREYGLRHIRMREDFLLLHGQGYSDEAEWYYQRLVRQLDRLSERMLLEDYQRTVLLVDPGAKQLDNLVWKYHWVVKNKLEMRARQRLHGVLSAAVEPTDGP